MILGIDASNIRAGGGVTHLAELLRAAEPMAQGFSRVVVWSGRYTLSQLEERPWLTKSHQSLLDKGLIYRVFWQYFILSRLARANSCDVLFVPGGSYAGDFRPMVTFHQNLLPFEWRELKRFGWSLMTIKFLLLRISQSRTFKRADGLIFLTQYARDAVLRIINTTNGKTTLIPHGVDERFIRAPREQMAVIHYSEERPFRVLYVSIIHVYKHQWHVAEAVAQLRKIGLPVVLDLVGPAYPQSLQRLRRTLDSVDPMSEFIKYHGAIPHEELHSHYCRADVCLFASSCETFGQILTEAMSAGLPIACSNRSAMHEILGDAGVYFDPENPIDIARALREMIDSPELQAKKAEQSFKRVQVYSWQRCANETFGFIADVGDNFGGK